MGSDAVPGRFYQEMVRIFGALPKKALARKLGVHHTSVIQWSRGSEPSREIIERICEKLGWSSAEFARLNWMVVISKSPPVTSRIVDYVLDDDTHVLIPGADNTSPPNSPLSPGLAREDRFAFSREWLAKVASAVDNLVIQRLRGNTMGAPLYGADTILIDTGRTEIQHDHSYVYRRNGNIYLSLIKQVPGGTIQLGPGDKENEPERVKQEEVQILGEIIWTARTLIVPQ